MVTVASFASLHTWCGAVLSESKSEQGTLFSCSFSASHTWLYEIIPATVDPVLLYMNADGLPLV